MNIRNKGFTLVELLVVIAVLGVLVLLAMPMFGGYTKDANFAKGIANAKMIEDASQLYYMDNEDWPRLTDEHYTQEQMEEYSERFYDNTGKEIELDPNGKYYDINYDGLDSYVKVNDDKRNYILQNPVGKVYYMENLSDRGLERVDYEEEKEKENEDVIFYGLTPEAYDGDLNTYSSTTGDLRWTGNLDNRELTITTYSDTRNSAPSYGIYATFYDKDGNKLTPIGTNDDVLFHPYKAIRTSKLIVPVGADRLEFRHILEGNKVIEIKEIGLPESMSLPSEIGNITVETNHHGAYLEWEDNADHIKYAIYKDSVFLEYVNESHYDDISLYSDHDYSYKIIPINEYGNAGQIMEVDVKTNRPEIVFRGLTPEAFDNNLDTYAKSVGTVTWEGNLDNKKISITTYSSTRNDSSAYGIYIAFYDENGVELYPEGHSKSIHHRHNKTTTSEVIVPEGTESIKFTSRLDGSPVVRVYDVSVVE